MFDRKNSIIVLTDRTDFSTNHFNFGEKKLILNFARELIVDLLK